MDSLRSGTNFDGDHLDGDECERCGGSGEIMAADGDPSDWLEDTYCGPDDETVECRRCGGTGLCRSTAENPEASP